jgi:putative transposase
MVEHWRVYRQSDHWLSQYGAMKYNDFLYDNILLHSHSIDAAQEAFYKAVKVVHAQRKLGITASFPHKSKKYRTTIWKTAGIRRRDDKLLLSLARGNDPIIVNLPYYLLEIENFREIKLVYNKSNKKYEWHFTVEFDYEIPLPPGNNVAAIDLGEIHPVAMTDGVSSIIISCRESRSLHQYREKRLAELRKLQSTKVKGSNRWWRIQKRINKFLAKNKAQRKDIDHKISRTVVDWCETNEVGTIVIGDVRNVGDGKRLHKKSQQKVSNSWSHGRIRTYIEYKAEAKGIVTVLLNEAYTSKTCCYCGNQKKVNGRIYSCKCGVIYHRDIGGASNILSRYHYDELAKIDPIKPYFFRPFQKVSWSVESRSRYDTAQVARLERESTLIY